MPNRSTASSSDQSPARPSVAGPADTRCPTGKLRPANTPGEPPILAADGVSVVVDGATLLPRTSLEAVEGECIALLGPNGAGKTTLLRALAGRMRLTTGSVTLRGAPLDERRPQTRSDVAALIEAPALYPDLTLEEHLGLITAAWRTDGTGLTEHAGAEPFSAPEPALGRFGLTPLRQRFPHELSSGQRQLVSLAVTFARPANVLLLDEPEQRLDPERLELVAEAITSARVRGTAVVFSSHSTALVERVADRSVRVNA